MAGRSSTPKFQALGHQLEPEGLDDETLDAIDRAEAQVERGEVHDWEDVEKELRAKFQRAANISGDSN
jgi:hypothetical protein